MATVKIFPDSDIVNGLAVVSTGDWPGQPPSYDNRERTQHTPDTTSDRWADWNGRYTSQEWTEDRNTQAAASGDTNYAASGVDAVVYLPAQAHRTQAIFGVAWSYGAAPTSGFISVESPSGTEVFRESVTAPGAGFIPFEDGFRGPRGSDVLVRLADGGSSKHVSLMGRRVE